MPFHRYLASTTSILGYRARSSGNQGICSFIRNVDTVRSHNFGCAAISMCRSRRGCKRTMSLVSRRTGHWLAGALTFLPYPPWLRPPHPPMPPPPGPRPWPGQEHSNRTAGVTCTCNSYLCGTRHITHTRACARTATWSMLPGSSTCPRSCAPRCRLRWVAGLSPMFKGYSLCSLSCNLNFEQMKMKPFIFIPAQNLVPVYYLHTIYTAPPGFLQG